jgi:molybdate transport system substrate-binding protein
MKRIWRWLIVVALSTAGLAHAQDGPVIAAASDLKFALDEIAVEFAKATGKSVRVTYGSSGNFFRQIVQDAPFELFLSADEEFVFKLADQGLTVDRGAMYATGRIVLFTPKGSAVRPDATFSDLRQAIGDGRLVKFAIANPEHAPYGRAAMEALKSAGLWSAIESKLVLGENVSQAAQFAVSGSTQGGIFALSLALAPSLRDAGTYVPIAEALHRPLRQRMVLTRKAGPTAREFSAFAQGPLARAVFKRYGFLLPGESAP